QSPPGSSLLYRQISLPSNAPAITLSWADCVRNFSTVFSTNQQYRVEIRNTNNLPLAVLYSTQPGNPLLGDWIQHVPHLSAYRGQTIRVAFVVNVGLGFLDVHLDEVSLRISSLPPVTYDVYFGTNSSVGSQFLGSTTNTTWSLPPLTPLLPYYW